MTLQTSKINSTFMKPSIEIQPLTPDHAPAVAKIHIVSQSGTFLTSLGEEFLTLLYRRISQSNFGDSYVARHNGNVVGFIVGTLSTKQMFKDVALKSSFHFGWLVFKQGLGRPALLVQALKTLAYPAQDAGQLPQAELLALAVNTKWRNNKIGGRLVGKLVQSMKTKNIDKMVVTVDGSNDGAYRFYMRHGFKQFATFEMYGRPMNHLILTVNEPHES